MKGLEDVTWNLWICVVHSQISSGFFKPKDAQSLTTTISSSHIVVRKAALTFQNALFLRLLRCGAIGVSFFENLYFTTKLLQFRQFFLLFVPVVCLLNKRRPSFSLRFCALCANDSAGHPPVSLWYLIFQRSTKL